MFDERVAFSKREAWLWLLSEAEWKPVSRNVGGKIIPLKRGQLAHSVRFMAEAWGWPKSNVARFLDRLKTETMIGTDTGTGVLIVTLCKYDEYQKVSLPKRDTNGTGSGTQVGQHRDRLEDSESSEIEEVPNGTLSEPAVADVAPPKPKATKRMVLAEFETWYAAYPHKVQRGAAERAFPAALRSAGSIAILLEGVRRYVATKPGDRPWQNPSTWLNGKGWLDAPAGAADASTPVAIVENRETWEKRLGHARRERVWATPKWGPMPRLPGCRVPAELLQQGDGIGWNEWKVAA